MRAKSSKAEAPKAGAEVVMLSISLFGKFSVRADDVEIDLPSRKTRALIGYLVLSEAQEQTRERLVGLLWSESPDERARASLRQALHELRNAFDSIGFGGLRTDKLAIALDRTRIRCDLVDALDAAASGDPHPRLLEQQNPLDDVLSEFESSDPVFQSWIIAKRQTVHNQIIRQLEAALRAQTEYSASTRRIAAAIINLDQTHEEACRFLIRAFVADGEIGSALKVYKTLWDLLDRDYDVEPTRETQDLIAEVKAALPFSGATPSPGPAVVPQAMASTPVLNLAHAPSGRARPAKLVLSVGPFRLSGSELKKDYLAQGFRRELIGCLVRFREWVVRDWETAQGNGDTGSDEFVLDASGYETPDALHFVLTLREGGTGSYLWSESLTLTLENWYQSQQALVRRVATALNVHVSAERMNQITIGASVDLRAYDIWLFGQATLLGFDQEKWDKAAELFRQVVQQRPDFAPAFSSLAQLNNSYHIVKPGVVRSAKRTQEALAYAHEAVRLDPLDSRSQLCLGWSLAMSKHYDQAMIYIPLAHDLNEHDPWTLVSAANCYAFCGRIREALDVIDGMQRNTSLALSRLQWAYHTAIRFMAGDYEGCATAADFAGDLNPNVPGFRAAALYHLGQQNAARAELSRFFAVARQRWSTQEPATPESITRWFLYMFPIAQAEKWACLRDGIAGAGAPVDGLAHHQW
jgi:DNA-binding SARP family transcriptional activator